MDLRVMLTTLGIIFLAEMGDKTQLATLLFALFPGTFAFSLAYNEGIVLTCIALGLLALMDRRWWLAGHFTRSARRLRTFLPG